MVASELISFFLEKDYKIIGLYRGKLKLKIKNKNIKFIKHDLKNEIKYNGNIDFIINAAATHEQSKNVFLKDYYAGNILSIKNLISFAKKKKIKVFINLSTITVLGNTSLNILNEKSKIENQSILGITKFVGEKLLEFSNIKYINLRLPGVLLNKKNKDRPWLNSIFYRLNKNKNLNIYSGNKKFNNVIDSYEIYKFLNFIFNKINFKKFNHSGTFYFSAKNKIILKKLINYLIYKTKSQSKIFYKTNRRLKNFTISTEKLKKIFNYDLPNVIKVIDRNFI